MVRVVTARRGRKIGGDQLYTITTSLRSSPPAAAAPVLSSSSQAITKFINSNPMGWFDDNDPNGQAAQDEITGMFGPGKWQKDPPKASGSSSRAPKRIERPEAEWGQLKHDFDITFALLI